MLRPAMLRSALRASSTISFRPAAATLPLRPSPRLLSTTAAALQKDDPSKGGEFARTRDSVRVEYPEDEELRASTPAQGRGGIKRTLASFSLEGRVAVVTGGARGLGLVMSQALVSSGASVAIVDLNSACLPSFTYPLLSPTALPTRREWP